MKLLLKPMPNPKVKSVLNWRHLSVSLMIFEMGVRKIEILAADQASQNSENDAEILEDVTETVESPVVTSSQVLRDFSLRSESRSSQSSYSEST